MSFFDSKTKTQTEQYSMDPLTQAQMINRVRALGRTPSTMYEGAFTAEMDPLQQEALGMQEQYARGLGGMMDPTMAAWRGMLTAPNVAQNPYVQGMLEQQQAQVQRGLSEAMPTLQAGMLGVNERLGGTGQGVAAGIMGRGAMQDLARQAAETQMGAYQAGLGQQRYGLGMAGELMGMGQMPAQILSGIGATRRAEEQTDIDEARMRHQFAQEEPWRRLERMSGVWRPLTQPYGKTTRESQEEASTASKIGQVAGLAASIGGMFAGIPPVGMLGMGGGASTPAMSPYVDPRGTGLDPYLRDIMSYQAYR